MSDKKSKKKPPSERKMAFLYSVGIHLLLFVLLAFKAVEFETPPSIIEIDLAAANIQGEGAGENVFTEPETEVIEEEIVEEEIPQPVEPPEPVQQPQPKPEPQPTPPQPQPEQPKPDVAETPSPEPDITPTTPPQSDEPTMPTLPKRTGLLGNTENTPVPSERQPVMPDFDLPELDVPDVVEPKTPTKPVVEQSHVPDSLGIPERSVPAPSDTPAPQSPPTDVDDDDRKEGVSFEIEGVVGNRRRVKSPPPAYPAGGVGDVVIRLKFEVDPEGRVSTIIPVGKGGGGLFERAATDALRLWRFEKLPDDLPQENQSGFVTFIFRTR